jgi:integrase
MARQRNAQNVGLPPRSRWLHGAIRYMVPPGMESYWDGRKQFTLGRTIVEAFETYAARVKALDPHTDKVAYIDQLLDKYATKVIPTSTSARTRENKCKALPILKKRFGHMRLDDFRPTHAYQYVSNRKNKKTGAPAITSAHRELEVLSHAFTWGVMWGDLDKHPIEEELRFEGALAPKARTRYVQNWELAAALALKPLRKKGSVRMCQAYIRLKLRTGLRMTDMLLLRTADCDEAGMHVMASKTANSTRVKQTFTWLDEEGRDTGLRAAVDEALAARPVDLAPWVFCTDEGTCYVDADTGKTSSFESVWHRFMDRVMKETEVKERFAERDIRAKVGSDLATIEEAQRLLGHADSRVTQKHYRRAAQVVRPAKPTVA